jgi:hypothetical protein
MAQIFVDLLPSIRRVSTELRPPVIATVNRTAVEIFDAPSQEWVSITEAKRRKKRPRR